jgi:predicted phage terminase large subunit-like protein
VIAYKQKSHEYESRVINYELEKELKKEIFKKSYFEFFKWSFNILFPNEKYEDAFHVKYLCDIYQKEVERIIRKEAKTKDIIVNIPPRTSKSLITSVCLLAWAWIKDPTIPMISVSFDDELTLINAQLCKDIIKSDEYQELFSDLFQIRKDIDSKGYFMNDKGGFRLSKTVGANITGLKGTIIVVDDPQNPKTAESEVFRKATIDYYEQSLYNRLTPINLGIRIIIMQRLHEEDLSGHLLKKNPEDYLHICLPAEESKLVKPAELKNAYRDGFLDPVRLSKSTLDAFKKTLGSRGYAGQYDQTPSPEEGGIIKKAWFDIIQPFGLQRDTINEPIHFFVDSAFTSKTENDPSAIIACFKQQNCLFVLDVVEQWLNFPDLIKFIGTYVKMYQYNSNSKIFIEPKASGLDIVAQLRVVSNLNVIEAPNPTKDKVSRAHGITAQLESRRVKLINGGYVDDFLHQLTAFPNGKHDDKVDVLVMAVNELVIKDKPDFFFI